MDVKWTENGQKMDMEEEEEKAITCLTWLVVESKSTFCSTAAISFSIDRPDI
jgi:hypothetical protein